MESVTCEHGVCAATGEHLYAHSLWAVLQQVDTQGYSFFQCEQGQEFRAVQYQHFHCSHTHMLAGMTACISSHYTDAQLRRAGGTVLHKMVLGHGLTCEQCAAPLDTVAYRFTLTQGLPWHRSDGAEHDHTLYWCCSLEHAGHHCLAFLASLKEYIP